MDGKFSSWTASDERSPGVADNTQWGCQSLDNTNDVSSHCGKVINEGTYGERWDGDLFNSCPQSLHRKEPAARMQGILPEAASSSSTTTKTSSYTHKASEAFSPDCQESPSRTTPDPIKYSSLPINQHPSIDNVREAPEDYMERIESVMSNMYNSVNDQCAAQQEDLKRDTPSSWTTVIKEALEMSNGMELEQDRLADMCGTPLIYDPPTESRAVEFVNSDCDPVDNESDVQERTEVTEAQEPTVMLSDDTKRSPFKPNQDFRQRTVIQYSDPLDGSSVNDHVLGETSCRIPKRCSSLEFYDTTEVCSLAQSKTTKETEVSYFTKRPCLSDELDPVRSTMHEQFTNLNEHTHCASNSTGNEKVTSVTKHVQHSSHRTYKEHAQSCKNVNTGKCMDSQTKSCTINNATLQRQLGIAGHHLKFETISAEQDDLDHKENAPTPTRNTMEDFQAPMEISRTWIESEESNLPSKKEESINKSNNKCTTREPDVLAIAAQSSCKVVRKKENGGAYILDDTPTCSQSYSSCELSSSDTNNTSLMINNTDKETDSGQIITQNIRNVGAVGDDTTAHYISQGQSLTVSTNPETGLSSVFSLENISKERKSEVNIGNPQTSTEFLEKETAEVEPYKDHSTVFVKHEFKIDPNCKSSCVDLSTPARMKKSVGCSFKKRKLLPMTEVFSTIQEPSKNITAHSGKFSRDLKKIKRKAEKIQSPPTNRRKSCRTAISATNLLQNSHVEIKEHRCRKSWKVKHPALVTDCGQNVNSSKMSTHHIGQVFKVSSGPQRNNFQKGASTPDRLLGCFEEQLNTEIHNEKHDNTNDFHSDTLLKTPSESQNKDSNVTESRKQTLSDKRNKEKGHSPQLNGDAGFELSLQSTINSTGFHSCITNAFYKKVKDKRSRNPLMGVSVKASDQHPGEFSQKDVGDKNSLCDSNVISRKHSPIQTLDRFTQYCDEDYVTTLNKGTHKVADAVKSTKIATKYINCKYCRRSFRHISAYTVHQRIHTAEKPYRCELCGKNFAQLSKLKSHRNVHVQSVSLSCPCCRKKFSEKRNLIAHFTTHVKGSKQNNEPGQQECKPDSPLRDPTRSKSIIGNFYNNKFPSGYMQKIHKQDRENLTSCKTCGKEFWTSQLVVHERTHWPVKPYACSICAKSFNQIKALKKHSQKHTGESPFSCSHCGCAFCDLPALRLHQISKRCNQKQRLNGENCYTEGFLVTHGVDGQVNTPMFFKCQICKQLYRKWCQYTLHLQTHAKCPSYLCSACGQSYEKDSEVTVHCRECCQTSGEEVACGSSLSEILHSDSRKCTYLKDSSPTDLYSIETSKSSSLSCAGQFHKNSQIWSNLQTEHLMPESSRFVKASRLPDNDDQLPPSPTPSVMTRASLNVSLECAEISPSLWRFKCPRCGQRYKRYKTLCLHMQTHAPAFRYVCGCCGHSFERWNKLWLHQRIHHRKGRCYTCSQCNVQFHFFSSYKMHLLKHVEERPYACPLCPQTFAHEDGLRVHQCNFHQPAKKLRCDVCDKSFSNLANLVKHSLLHNGAISHQCIPCNLSFANNKRLQEHLNIHHNSASLLPCIPSEPLTFLHKCSRCKSSFSTGDLLYAHQICHAKDLKCQVRYTQSIESTSVGLGGTWSSSSRSLLSTLDLDAIPKESLFKYPHPDKLYVPPRLLGMSKSIPLINLDSGDEDPQEASVSPNNRTGPSGQKNQESSREYSETEMVQQPQALESQESVQSPNPEEIPVLDTVTDNLQDKASHDIPTKTAEFVETSVFLEGLTTTVNAAENEIQDEIFECADCSEKLGSLIGLYEHYFLHALGNTRRYTFP
ncbi:hypothetical protein AMELA_G00171620 [Ameiurus melas]|uniref:C2H2-type domain-containing protein n=1 Tax=Ameiurus melas TaxID=219545 RepID=A0A7J6ACX5_AMEME|nr:hypothetical protein AMELA_G00171620 [Ameiurus melas]